LTDAVQNCEREKDDMGPTDPRIKNYYAGKGKQKFTWLTKVGATEQELLSMEVLGRVLVIGDCYLAKSS
jgi:hypothetical protein